MAIRSSAGTGVIVSLVVFVLATVFLLVLSIVFYASGRAQKEETKNLVKAFDVYANTDERSKDTIVELVAKAESSDQSVVSYLYSELEERNRILTGNKNAELAEITTVFRETTSANSSLALTVGTLNRGLASRQAEVDSYLSELASAKSAIKSLEDQLNALSQSKADEVELVKSEWEDVQNQSIKLNSEVNTLFTSRKERGEDVRSFLEEIIVELEEELQNSRVENAKQAGALKDLRQQRDIGELYKTDPSLLVDGVVIGVENDNRVSINRGLQDKIRLGMSFEVYDRANQLQEDSEGNMPAGKASIEVVEVGETTSFAKVRRSTPNQPILKNNVLVNAIYDPNYSFSFLVHGVFDADGDGNPETTNDFIKNRIKRWGGVVVEDNGQLPGDLDFLVLGIAPIEPLSKLPMGASKAMEENYNRKQARYQSYIRLLEKARAADVPVLTANRLQILTGQKAR
jgi:hypothetical protein